MKRSPLITLLFLLIFCNDSLAAMRCGKYVIDIGDYKYDVLRKCGEPEIKERRNAIRGQELRDPGNTFELNRYDQVIVDDWIYNFGPRRLRQRLLFENDVLIKMRDLGYGY